MKTYSKEELEKKDSIIQVKFNKYHLARQKAEKSLIKLQKNKNLWKQYCKQFGVSETSNFGDWAC